MNDSFGKHVVAAISGREGEEHYEAADQRSAEADARSDLAQHLFDTAAAMNRATAEQLQRITCTKCGEGWADNAHVCNAQKVARLERSIERYREACEEAIEWIEGYVDIRDGEYGPRPNDAMKATQYLEWALGRRYAP